MKQILLIASILFSLQSAAEIKTDTANNYKYVDIAPAVFLSDTATRLSIPAFTDNNYNVAVAYVVLYRADGSKVTDFNVTISGSDYSNWNGNNPESIYIIVSRIKHFTIND